MKFTPDQHAALAAQERAMNDTLAKIDKLSEVLRFAAYLTNKGELTHPKDAFVKAIAMQIEIDRMIRDWA